MGKTRVSLEELIGNLKRLDQFEDFNFKDPKIVEITECIYRESESAKCYYDEGYKAGYEVGYDDADEDAYNQGYDKGYAVGYDDGVKSMQEWD